MKTTTLLLFALTALIPRLLFSQPPRPGIEITKATSRIIYEPVFVLEEGTANVLHIEVEDTSVNRLLVNSSQGTVKQEGSDFIITPEKKGELALAIYNYNDIGNPVFIAPG